MRIPRIYTPQSLQSSCNIELEEQTAHYLSKVLRMEVGRDLILFNGQGGQYQAKITEAHKKKVQVEILQHLIDNRESPLNSELAIGISRGERMDLVIQKATELGVSTITPLFTERTEVKLSGSRLDKKLQHWQQIAVSACEQSQRNLIPEVTEPQAFSDFIGSNNKELKFVLHHRSSKQLSAYNKPVSCCFLIGPEGGLSEAEIEQAEGKEFEPLSLGPRVLRTETAPLAALTLAQYLWGDF